MNALFTNEIVSESEVTAALRQTIASLKARIEVQNETIEECRARIAKLDCSLEENFNKRGMYLKMIDESEKSIAEHRANIEKIEARLAA